MPEFKSIIPEVRNAICAILRTRVAKRIPAKKNKPAEIKFNIGFVGTGWCFVENKYVATAHHVLNHGKERKNEDKFFVFTVPNNGDNAFHTPVVGFPHENASIDMAVLEVSPVDPFHLNSLPVTFSDQGDGEAVLTCGFPAPTIAEARVDESGNWLGGKLLLKSHANEGIIAAQYPWDNHRAYELNVGWHHGESGGPILSCDRVAVFAVMQFYRNIEGALGTVAGPRMGRAVIAMESILRDLGATVI